MSHLKEKPVLVMYRARRNSKLLCNRLVVPVKDGTKILVKDKMFGGDGWIEATYSMRKWPFDDADHDESAGYQFHDEWIGESWRPILDDDEVIILGD